MATAEEILALALEESKVLVVDNDLRKINIPKTVTHLGVESDDDVLRLEFSMPKTYGEFDLSEFEKRINILNAKGEPDIYKVEDAAVSEDGGSIAFTWLVGRPTVAYKGNVNFSLCLRKFAEDGVTVVKEFNTTRATLPVLEGLEVDQAIVDMYADIVAQWMADTRSEIDQEKQDLLRWYESAAADFEAWKANETAAFESWRKELLISDDNGIFPNPTGTEFGIRYDSIDSGRMIFEMGAGLCHIEENYKYYDAQLFYVEVDYENDRQMWISIRYDYTSGNIQNEKLIRDITDGDFTVPLATRDSECYELIVGAVNIPAGAMNGDEVTFIDARADQDRCGYVSIPFDKVTDSVDTIVEVGERVQEAKTSVDQAVGNAERFAKDAEISADMAVQAAANAQTSEEGAAESQRLAEDAMTEAQNARDKAYEYLEVSEDAMEEAQKSQGAAAESQRLAEDAMTESKKAANSIKGMDVSYEVLEPGNSASVEKTEVEGVFNLKFKIPKAKDGSNFRVLDYYDTYEDMIAANPNPEIGVVYGVGTEEPYDIWIYGETSGWKNNGPLQGAEGEAGAVFTPHVDDEGNLSWSNNGELPNPETKNLRGPAGKTPERGTDYWTAADKQEVVSEVLAALPNADATSF